MPLCAPAIPVFRLTLIAAMFDEPAARFATVPPLCPALPLAPEKPAFRASEKLPGAALLATDSTWVAVSPTRAFSTIGVGVALPTATL